jgi:uncharacterized protein YdeI (YjbR/CyaY-like superfamily)
VTTPQARWTTRVASRTGRAQIGQDDGVSPLDVAQATPVSSAEDFDRWLRDHGASRSERIVAIYKKASGRQTVTFEELLDTALCHGWVDTQTKGIDEERYAIRFVPRRSGSTWSATNRERVRRLRREGRMTPAGEAMLPPDL